MKDEHFFGVNQRGDMQWLAWTCHATDDGRLVPGTFREISLHATEEEAHAVANAAREKHNTAAA
jgi:hypothetical protein